MRLEQQAKGTRLLVGDEAKLRRRLHQLSR